MADVTGLISMQVTDYLGVTVSSDLPIKSVDTNTLATLVTQIQGYQTVFDDVTGGQITRCRVSFDVPLTAGLKDAPVSGDEVEMTGLFNYRQTGSVYKYGIDIPAIAASVIVDGKIDLTNAAIEAFDAWLKIAHSQVQAVSKYALLLASMADALISFRKHRKAQTRRSLEVG